MTTYVPAAPTPPEETAHLFTNSGGPVENPHAAAMAIMAAIVTHEPSDWATLAKHLGTEEITLYGVSERLQLIHGMAAVGPETIGHKLDTIADYWSRYHAKAIRQRAEAVYRTGQDEHGFSLPQALPKVSEGSFTWPDDAQDPTNPGEFAARLIAAIEEAKAVSYDSLADKLGCDLSELMKACRNLSMNHGHDKLSSRSLHFYFQHHSDRLAALSRDKSFHN